MEFCLASRDAKEKEMYQYQRPLPPPDFMKDQARYRREKIKETGSNWGKSVLWGLLFLLVMVGVVVLFHLTL